VFYGKNFDGLQFIIDFKKIRFDLAIPLVSEEWPLEKLKSCIKGMPQAGLNLYSFFVFEHELRLRQVSLCLYLIFEFE
jgi:hypothetical protein